MCFVLKSGNSLNRVCKACVVVLAGPYDMALDERLHLRFAGDDTAGTDARQQAHGCGNKHVREHGAGPVHDVAHQRGQHHLWQVESTVEGREVGAHAARRRRHSVTGVVEIQLQQQQHPCSML